MGPRRALPEHATFQTLVRTQCWEGVCPNAARTEYGGARCTDDIPRHGARPRNVAATGGAVPWTYLEHPRRPPSRDTLRIRPCGGPLAPRRAAEACASLPN